MNFGIKDAANLFIKKKSDGKMFLYTPYANVTTNEWTADQVEARAKGVRAIIWNHNKQSTLNVECEVFEMKWLAMMAGSDWITGSTEVLRREVVTTDELGAATLSGTPVENSLSVFELGSDGVSFDSEVEGATVSGNELTITDLVNTKIVVFYMEAVENAKKLTFKFDKYPENFEIFGDVMITPKDGGNPEFVQMHWGNAKPQSNFTITLDAANPTNLSITFDLLPDENGDMATYTHI